MGPLQDRARSRVLPTGLSGVRSSPGQARSICFQDLLVKYGGRSTCGSSLAYISLGHPQVRTSSGQARSTLFYDPPVRAAVRFALWLGLVYFPAGCSEVRSRSGQVRPMFLGSVCEIWVRFTLGHASITCRSNTRRSYLFEGSAGLVLFEGPPVQTGVRCTLWHRLRFACAPKGPIYFRACPTDDVSGIRRCNLWSALLCAVSPLLFARRAPGGPICCKASPI